MFLGKCHMLGDIMAPYVGVLAVGLLLVLDRAARTNLVLEGALELAQQGGWQMPGGAAQAPCPSQPLQPQQDVPGSTLCSYLLGVQVWLHGDLGPCPQQAEQGQSQAGQCCSHTRHEVGCGQERLHPPL